MGNLVASTGRGRRSACGTSQPTVQGLLRGIGILRLLNLHAGLTASDIGRKAGLPRITSYRMLKTLQQGGYVTCDKERRYRLGPAVLELNSLYAKQSWVIDTAAPLMQRLCKELRWPLVLGASNGPRMAILHTTRDETGFWLRMMGPGSHLPILGCAMGLAYLAYCAPESRRALIHAALETDGPETPEFIKDPRKIDVALSTVRAQGVASLKNSWASESVPLSALAVPIIRGGEPYAALALTYYRASMSTSEAMEAYVRPLQCLAREIADAL